MEKNLKEKIIEILKSKASGLSETWVTEDVILESDFDDVAKELIEYAKSRTILNNFYSSGFKKGKESVDNRFYKNNL